MRVVSVGGGPAGLYFGILMRRAFPRVRVEIHERNRPDDTFGFGVVFSDETLGALAEADPGSFAALRERFRSWTDIRTWYRGRWTRSSGHGFSALSRAALLEVLQRHALEAGCELAFESEVADVERHLEADLVLGADGVNSSVRGRFAAEFRPHVELGACRFCWLGSDLPLDAFTFLFAETEHGLFQVHAYPYAADRSTFIVETHDGAWRAAGLDRASEADTVAICERLFAGFLDGHRLLANRSIWRQFPTLTCEAWSHGHVALLGDAAHTAHFSIGSGTKLAMEDAIALVEAFRASGLADVPRALAGYEARRRPEVAKIQRAARDSRRWFESSRRYFGQVPEVFTFNLMTRSKRITYDSLRQRDPALVASVDAAFQRVNGGPGTSAGTAPPPAFTPFSARSVTLRNRIVVSPMCQYSAADGAVGDWHLMHLGARAIGGAGLVIAEMTDVSPEGRITPYCAGLWSEAHTAAWRRVVEFVHAHSAARIGIQLAHAGRKASMRHPWAGGDVPLAVEDGGWIALAPSAVPFRPEWPAPRAMGLEDLERVREAFVAAARRADEAGFDWLELHFAHGYLLSSFLSPLANFREDRYGGSLANRMRYPLEVFGAVRAAWPTAKPMSVRISATDWFEEEGRGTTLEDSVALARELRDAGCDVIDVSSGGNSPDSRPDFGRMYQVPFAERIRFEAGVRVMAVGGIMDADHANTVLGAGRADLVAIARAHLADPHLTLRAASRYGVEVPWPGQYLRGKPPAGR
ncbi:MAG: yqjM [Acidobacteria bacterium]|nr:yqjM [Acidobacteriota bacterium]